MNQQLIFIRIIFWSERQIAEPNDQAHLAPFTNYATTQDTNDGLWGNANLWIEPLSPTGKYDIVIFL